MASNRTLFLLGVALSMTGAGFMPVAATAQDVEIPDVTLPHIDLPGLSGLAGDDAPEAAPPMPVAPIPLPTHPDRHGHRRAKGARGGYAPKGVEAASLSPNPEPGADLGEVSPGVRLHVAPVDAAATPKGYVPLPAGKPGIDTAKLAPVPEDDDGPDVDVPTDAEVAKSFQGLIDLAQAPLKGLGAAFQPQDTQTPESAPTEAPVPVAVDARSATRAPAVKHAGGNGGPEPVPDASIARLTP